MNSLPAQVQGCMWPRFSPQFLRQLSACVLMMPPSPSPCSNTYPWCKIRQDKRTLRDPALLPLYPMLLPPWCFACSHSDVPVVTTMLFLTPAPGSCSPLYSECLHHILPSCFSVHTLLLWSECVPPKFIWKPRPQTDGTSR